LIQLIEHHAAKLIDVLEVVNEPVMKYDRISFFDEGVLHDWPPVLELVLFGRELPMSFSVASRRGTRCLDL
jgi:hypothetical protein